MKRNIDGTTTPDLWNLADSDPVLEIYADQGFDTTDNQRVLQGDVPAGILCLRIPCTVVTGQLVVPTIEDIDTTLDSPDNQRATYSAYIRTTTQPLIDWLIGFKIPPSTTTPVSSISWTSLRVLKQGGILTREGIPNTLEEAAIIALIESYVNIAIGTLNDASTIVKGRVYLSDAATLPTSPIAISATSPLIPAFVLHTSKYASANLAQTAINALGGGTVICDAPCLVTADFATTASTEWKFEGQGMLTGTAKTVTIVGPLSGPPKQLFASGVTISFTGSVVPPTVLWQWYGVVADGATDNAAAMARCVASAKTGARSIHAMDGYYKFSDTLVIGGYQGFHLTWENRLTTRFEITVANKTAVLINHGSYGVLERPFITTSAASDNTCALLDIDSDGSIAALKTQQISIYDPHIHGQFLAANGLRISKSGNTAQGDTILISNPVFIACMEAGFKIVGQNTLGITIEGGDVQSCPFYGIYNNGGQVFIKGTSFQNQAQALGLTSADGIQINQITLGGGDYYSDFSAGASSVSSMTDIRSESDVLARLGLVNIDKAAVNHTSAALWQAAAVYSGLGQLIHGTVGAGQKGEQGRTFMLVVNGTSGGTEPTWSSAASGKYNPFRYIPSAGWITVAGSNVITSEDVNGFSAGSGGIRAPAVGDYVMVYGAGTGGGPFISRVTGFATPGGAELTVADNAVTSTPLGTAGYISTPVTDGTAKWIDIDFDTVRITGHLMKLNSNGGRIAAALSIRDSLFNRADAWHYVDGNGITQATSPTIKNTLYSTAGDYNTAPFARIPDTSPGGDDVASANTITATGSHFTLTGTTTIKNITSTNIVPGTMLIIKCTGVLTFDETGNLVINGAATSFTTTAGDIVFAYWDGSKWQLIA